MISTGLIQRHKSKSTFSSFHTCDSIYKGIAVSCRKYWFICYILVIATYVFALTYTCRESLDLIWFQPLLLSSTENAKVFIFIYIFIFIYYLRSKSGRKQNECRKLQVLFDLLCIIFLVIGVFFLLLNFFPLLDCSVLVGKQQQQQQQIMKLIIQ